MATYTRVSTKSSGAQLQGEASQASYSPDGAKVVFVSNDQFATSTRTFGPNAYVKDLVTGAVTLVSVNASGVSDSFTQLAGRPGVFSPDGGAIVFTAVSRLTPADTDTDTNRDDVYIKDLATGGLTLISASSGGVKGNGDSFDAVFSPDGRSVVFTSQATNLITGMTLTDQEVYRKDLASGVVTLVSSSATGAAGNGFASNGSYSPDGLSIAFYSSSSNLVPGDANGRWDVFLKSLTTGAVRLVSVGVAGAQGDGNSYFASFSPDGLKLLFTSSASNLTSTPVPGGKQEAYVKDLTTGVVTLVSTTAAGVASATDVDGVAWSPDGATVVFNNQTDLFVKDLATGVLTSVAPYGHNASFAPDGRTLLFTDQRPLAPEDTNSQNDVYTTAFPLGAAAPTLALPATYNGAANDTGASSSDGITRLNRPVVTGVASQPGAIVTLYDTNGTTVLGTAVSDATTGAFAITPTVLVDGVHQLTAVATVAGAASERSAKVVVTVDTVAPTITSFTYGPNDGDLSTGEAGTLVYGFSEAVTQFPTQGNARPAPSLTLSTGAVLQGLPAGLGTSALTYTYVPAAGQTTSDLAVTGADLNGGPAGFFNDVAGNAVAGTPVGNPPGVLTVNAPAPAPALLALVSSSAAGVEGNAASYTSNIKGGFTADGVSVLFSGGSTNLTSADTNTTFDLYLKNTATGAVTLVSTNAAGVRPNADVFYGSVDGDGNLAAFTTTATNLDPRATDGNSHLYVRDVSAGSLTLIAPADYVITNGRRGSVEAASNFTNLVGPSISGDGRYVAVQGNAGGATAEILLFDTVTHTARDLSGLGFVGSSAAISQSGSAVVFHTTADLNTPAGGVREVYVYSVQDDAFALVSASGGVRPVAANGDSVLATASNNGRVAAFQSVATNLDARDTDTRFDVYARDIPTNTLYLVDVAADGVTKANAAATNAYVSGDGTRVAFQSAATNLVAGVADGLTHVYVKTLATGALAVLDLSAAGAPGNGGSSAAVFSPDGARVAFSSTASNLVADDANGVQDVFLAKVGAGAVTPPPPTVNTPPAIGGTMADQQEMQGQPIQPFSTVTVTDPDTGQIETVTIDTGGFGPISGGGFVQSPTDTRLYTVSGTAAQVQAALRAASFTSLYDASVATFPLTVTVSDGIATTTDATTTIRVVAASPPLPPGGGGGGAPPVTTTPSTTYGLITEAQNLFRALPTGADAQDRAGPLYAQFEAEKGIADQLDRGQITLAQADLALAHLVDGTTSVAVASYAFFTGRTPSLAGLNYLVHSPANATDLNDPYYARFSTENRYINFAVGLGSGTGAGAAAFQAGYGGLSLADATAKAYLAVFGVVADTAKVSALLTSLVPDGLGGQETRAQYFAQYGGDGPNGQGTKAALIGFLLSNAVHDGSGVYGAATEHYLATLAHGLAPTFDTDLVLAYGQDVSLVGVRPTPDVTVTG